MEVSVLLRRQMELHGMLRRPPHTPADLKGVHNIMKELKSFFSWLKTTASALECSPESVFQCLMHIGVGDVVNFDKQKRDGAVPMHQAKVLTRANAIELEPRLRAAFSDSALDVVALSKTMRTLLRIKVEDGNDLNTAETALHEFIEYLDFIDAASGNVPEVMFKFYMVEDEMSLLSLLGRDVSQEACGLSDAGASMKLIPPLPNYAKLEDEIRRLAHISSSLTEPVGNRLNALRTIDCWMDTIEEDRYLEYICYLASHLSGPLSICAGEKRSAICRQACMIIVTIAMRTPAKFFNEGALKVALCKWSVVLVRGVFVGVSAVAQATDTALRALVIGSGGNAALIKNIISGLESGTHPELRRKCLGYLALGVVVSRGDVCATSPQLGSVATKYMELGDTACRKMARALCVTLMHFTGGPEVVGNKKTESLIRQERAELMTAFDDIVAFEAAIFGDVAEKRFSSNSTVRESTGAVFANQELERDVTPPTTADIYDTSVTLGGSCNNTGLVCMQSQPKLRGEFETEPIKSPRPYPVRLSVSLQRKIKNASSRSTSHN